MACTVARKKDVCGDLTSAPAAHPQVPNPSLQRDVSARSGACRPAAGLPEQGGDASQAWRCFRALNPQVDVCTTPVSSAALVGAGGGRQQHLGVERRLRAGSLLGGSARRGPPRLAWIVLAGRCAIYRVSRFPSELSMQRAVRPTDGWMTVHQAVLCRCLVSRCYDDVLATLVDGGVWDGGRRSRRISAGNEGR